MLCPILICVGALAALAPPALAAARAAKEAAFVSVAVTAAGAGPFYCARHRTNVSFGGDGSITRLDVGGMTVVAAGGGGVLGRTTYQTLSSDNFTTFDRSTPVQLLL